MSEQTDLDRTRTLLEEIGFEFAGHLLPELLERGVREKLTQSRLLDLVLTTERDAREERRVKTSLKLSGLSAAKTLESFDFAFARGVDRRKVELLATCEFARRRENVLLLGPPGVGKTHLALALGVKAVQNGFSVASMSADELLDQLRRDDAAGLRRVRRRRYSSVAVLIIDELGFQTLDRRDAHLLFKVLTTRYERSSTIITSNTSIRDWPAMLAGDEMLATAFLDRLLHHCHVLQIDGRSFRLREIESSLRETD